MEDLALRLSGVNKRENDPTDLRKAVGLNHTPLKELHDTVNALYKFINDTSEEAESCPISFDQGSFVMVAKLPEETSIYLESVISSALVPDEPYHKLLVSLERISRNSGLEIDLSIDKKLITTIRENVKADYELKEVLWFTTELLLFGEVINMGGKKPNIHLVTENYGEIIIAIDHTSIQEIKPYQWYHIQVEAEQSWGDPTKLKNVRFVRKVDDIGRIDLNTYIKNESPNWESVDSVSFVRSIRGGGNEIN